MDRSVGIIECDKDSHKAPAIDGRVKNKFKWVWMENNCIKEFPLSEWLHKVDIPHPNLKNLA